MNDIHKAREPQGNIGQSIVKPYIINVLFNQLYITHTVGMLLKLYSLGLQQNSTFGMHLFLKDSQTSYK